MNITVLFNKPSVRFERDATHKDAEEDTEESAHEIRDALTTKGVDVTLCALTEQTIDEGIAGLRSDLVFNVIEWTGVDTPLAMHAFDELNKRHLLYTGATKQNYRDTCDKTRLKKLLDDAKLPTAQWQNFITGHEPIRADLRYPMIVKVSLEHSSVGIAQDSIVRNSEELQRIVRERIIQFRQPVFAETFLSGREFQVTLLEQSDGLTILPPAEIVYKSGTDVPLLTYKSRWDMTHSDYTNSEVCIAELSETLGKKLDVICRDAFRKLGFRDYARFDIRCDDNERPYFLELNSNPGLGDDPEYGMTVSYKAVGMSFSDFVWEIVQSTLRR